MDLIALLTAFGADDALIALAQTWVDRPAADADAATLEAYTPLSDEDLATLLTGLQALGDNDEAGVGLLLAAADVADAIRTEQTTRDEAAEAEEAAAQAAIARLRGEPVAEDPDPDADPADPEDPADPDAEPADPDAEVPDAPADAEPEAVMAAATRSARRQRAHRPATDLPAEGDTPRARIEFAYGVDDRALVASGQAPTLVDVDRALVERAQSFRRGGTIVGREDVPVASIFPAFPADRILSDDPERNARLVTDAITQGMAPRAMAAAGGLCAPLTPYYGVPVLGDDRRPVRDALVGFQATRGGITQIAPPILPNLAGSSIIWTADNDEDPDDPATKPCLRVECGTPRSTEMYAVPVCLEFGNFLARTYSELTEAWSNLSLTAHARLAEQTLLAAIKTASTKPNTVETVTSAVADTLIALDQAAMGMRSRHRLPETYPFRVFGPETWLFQARTNMARALPGGSFQENLALAQASINAWFAAKNLSVTWTPDLGVIGQQAASTALAEPDSTQEWAIYPEGTFLFLDGGRLDLGVVRDSALIGTNDFQTFAETFEGLHMVGVEALWLTINTCASGAVNGTLDPAAMCASYT